MKIYSHSEQGKRQYQQDRFLVKDNLFVVCDGMGGHANGELAAEAGIDRMDEIDFNKEGTPAQHMREAINLASEDCSNAGDNRGSTVVAVHLDDEAEMLTFANIGDSRIYYINSTGIIEQMTEDHATPMGYLTSCLGMASQIDVGTKKFRKGDQILLLSDGVFGAFQRRDSQNPLKRITLNYQMVKEIKRAKAEGWDAAEHLCHDAIARGSTDNCTAILIEL